MAAAGLHRASTEVSTRELTAQRALRGRRASSAFARSSAPEPRRRIDMSNYLLVIHEPLQRRVDGLLDRLRARDAPGPLEESVIDVDEPLCHENSLSILDLDIPLAAFRLARRLRVNARSEKNARW